MLKIEEVEVVGLRHAIRGMRNPKNSWSKSDSGPAFPLCNELQDKFTCAKFNVGPNDLDLMSQLSSAGTDHRKFMRMIVVYLDITAPLYWWKEFDTYKVGAVANSCSTMHMIHSKEFTLDDFSHEHLADDCEDDVCTAIDVYCGDCEWNKYYPMDLLREIIKVLNKNRDMFLSTKDKKFWWQMIQLLPSSYNQKRTIMLSYEVLANMYRSRVKIPHKLDEWRYFGNMIEALPHSNLITEAR